MEQFSAAELAELLYLASGAADAQFQNWITVTFAAVVAGFAAGSRLNLKLRILAAVLYVLASFVIIFRFFREGLSAIAWGAALVDMGVDVVAPVSTAVIIGRGLLFALGTVAALYFLLKAQK